jgi:aminopeptidase N
MLATGAILSLAAGEAVALEPLAAGYRRILEDAALLDEFKAGTLRLPGIAVLEAARTPADPVALFAARRGLLAALGRALAPEIGAAIASRAGMAGSAGGRSLLTQLVELGVAAGDAKAVTAAESMVSDRNMTISQGGLKALIHSDDPARVRALQVFHDRWQADSLVMEKWFQMESMSSVGGTLDRLDELMRHPGFDAKNPNKIRAVLGAFMVGNTPGFHAGDGSGYSYMAERLVEIDTRNPQIAARMALPMTRMANYDGSRQKLMRAALATIKAGAGSNDLKEVVDKAL